MLLPIVFNPDKELSFYGNLFARDSVFCSTIVCMFEHMSQWTAHIQPSMLHLCVFTNYSAAVSYLTLSLLSITVTFPALLERVFFMQQLTERHHISNFESHQEIHWYRLMGGVQSFCLSVSLSLCLPVSLSPCLPLSLCLSLSLQLSVWVPVCSTHTIIEIWI